MPTIEYASEHGPLVDLSFLSSWIVAIVPEPSQVLCRLACALYSGDRTRAR
jgi:hypothetical protein